MYLFIWIIYKRTNLVSQYTCRHCWSCAVLCRWLWCMLGMYGSIRPKLGMNVLLLLCQRPDAPCCTNWRSCRSLCLLGRRTLLIRAFFSLLSNARKFNTKWRDALLIDEWTYIFDMLFYQSLTKTNLPTKCKIKSKCEWKAFGETQRFQ